MTSPFCFASWCLQRYGFFVKLDALKNISVAAFCIIGYKNSAFLPLDWIYRSIRIMTVMHGSQEFMVNNYLIQRVEPEDITHIMCY